MIIIIEGPDGSGKTTLAKQMSKDYGYELIHFSQPKTEEEKKNMLLDYMRLVKDKDNVILDRCWYSEMVYGKIMRGKSVLSYDDMYALEHLAKGKAIIVYCTGAEEVLWERCQKRGEEYVTSREDFKAIYDKYKCIMNYPHLLPVFTYEYKEM